jgi:uncharacterized protein YjbI with pentapeptide repeats
MKYSICDHLTGAIRFTADIEANKFTSFQQLRGLAVLSLIQSALTTIGPEAPRGEHAHRVNLADTELSEADLKNARLNGTDFTGANLRGANLAGADLAHTNLAYAELGRAKLTAASLRGAILTRAKMVVADLSGADLTDADLREASPAGSDLSGATVVRANLHRAFLETATAAGVDLAQADLSCARLAGVDLGDANLTGADLHDADLARANLAGADFSGANLTNASLAGANVAGADFTRARNVNLAESLVIRHEDIPIVRNIDAAILAGIEAGGEFVGGTKDAWSRAGWAIHLAGQPGQALSDKIGKRIASALIYRASRPGKPAPWMLMRRNAALEDIRRCAAEQPGPYLDALIDAADARQRSAQDEALVARDAYNALAVRVWTLAEQQNPEFKAAEERMESAGMAWHIAALELEQLTRTTEEGRVAWKRRGRSFPV